MVIAAVLLVIFYEVGWLNAWTLIFCVCIPPTINYLLVGKTDKKEIVIEK